MRIRTLKPEWLTDEKMEALEDSARLLSAGLILLADDHGRGRAAAAQIAGAVWPSHLEHDPRETIRKTREGLASLSTMGFLRLYEVRGQSYFEISNWTRHQKVDKPSKPRIPAPPETLAESSRDPRETLAPDLRSPTSDHRPPTTTADLTRVRATPAEVSQAVEEAHEANNGPEQPPWVRVLERFDREWELVHGCALGVEMAAAQHRLKAEGVVKWARKQAGDDWEALVSRAAAAFARGASGNLHSPFAAWASAPGAALTKRAAGPAPPRKSEEFTHDDPDEFWDRVDREHAAEQEAKRAAGG